MSYKLKYNSKAQIIEVKVQGSVTLAELREIYFQGIQLAKEKECFLVLSDFRKATALDFPLFEMSSLPQALSDLAAAAGIDAKRLKRAIVFAPNDVATYFFAERVANTHGQNAKMFQNIDEARTWLLGTG